MSDRVIVNLSKTAIILATLIWGTSFFIMKNTLGSIGSFYLLAIRFTIASVLLSVIFMGKFKKLDRAYLRGGAILGLLIGSAYALQTIGLTFTTPGKNAFLTAVYCLLVPFINWAVAGSRPDSYNISAAIICMAGVGLVSITPGAESLLNIGDVLTLAGGVMYAFHIVAVNKLAGGKDIILLTVLQFAFAALFFWIAAPLTETFPKALPNEAILSLAYLGVMCTAAALLLQNIGQKYTPPATAALLLSLEAVFGVIFSVIFADEHLSVPLVLGFTLIFAALVISEAKPFGKKSEM